MTPRAASPGGSHGAGVGGATRSAQFRRQLKPQEDQRGDQPGRWPLGDRPEVVLLWIRFLGRQHGLGSTASGQAQGKWKMESAEISALMAEILGISQVAPQDNFFELGGNSIQVLALVTKINENSDADLSLVDVVFTPTADGIAEKMQRGGSR